MHIPSVEQAKAFLDDARQRNPGPWVEHSLVSAAEASHIAQYHPELDPAAGYTLALLHDIGRRSGVAHMRHILDGYYFLCDQGYPDAARICLTHSFPVKDTRTAFGNWDCSPEERQFVEGFLENTEYTLYDKLVQLCDYLSLPSGFCPVEKRMIDVALRYGANEYAVKKWKAVFEIKEGLEKTIGRSIYSVLPGIVENTFASR